MGYNTYVAGEFTLKSKYKTAAAWEKIKELGAEAGFEKEEFNDTGWTLDISGDDWRMYYAHKKMFFLKRFFVGDLECSGEDDDDKYRISFEEDGSIKFMKYQRVEGTTVDFLPNYLGFEKEWAEEEAREIEHVIEETQMKTNEKVI